MKKTIPGTGFRNVDLEIRSRTKLDALEAAMGKAAFVLYSGPVGPRKYLLSMELNCEPCRKSAGPEAFIAAFCDIIDRFSPVHRRLWDRASKRTFDIGWECDAKESSSSFALEAETLHRIASLGATLAVTFYHCRKEPKRRATCPLS